MKIQYMYRPMPLASHALGTLRVVATCDFYQRPGHKILAGVHRVPTTEVPDGDILGLGSDVRAEVLGSGVNKASRPYLLAILIARLPIGLTFGWHVRNLTTIVWNGQ